MNKPLHQNGFSLLEVLVAMIIIAVGLLGLAGLQARALEGEMESYQRAQALILLEDMANRINTNREAAQCYNLGDVVIGTDYSGTFVCDAYGTTDTQSIAISDLTAWNRLLQGSSETVDGTNVGAMIDARGCITLTTETATTRVFQITVAWQGLKATYDDADANGCASALYDGKRRYVSTTVRIPELS